MPEWLPSAITWLISTGIGAAVGYAAIRSRLENHEVRIKAIEIELGTRETGMRGAIHESANFLLKLEGRIMALEDDE